MFVKVTFFTLFFLLFSCSAVKEVNANEYDALNMEVTGQWIQGALLRGKTHPSNIVSILDKPIYVDESGGFVFGLNRDAKKLFNIKVTSLSGKTKTYEFEVTQREYNIQYIEGVAGKYVSPAQSVLDRINKEAVMVKQARKTKRLTSEFQEQFQWPLIGRITGVYGSQRVFNGVPSRPHFGIDIAAPTGEKVVAPASGVVTLVHDDMYYSGGTLIIDHGQGVSSTFLHLSELLVENGDEIKQGQLIALVGSGGRSTGAHLDWRINWFGQRLDPGLLVSKMPEKKMQ